MSVNKSQSLSVCSGENSILRISAFLKPVGCQPVILGNGLKIGIVIIKFMNPQINLNLNGENRYNEDRGKDSKENQIKK